MYELVDYARSRLNGGVITIDKHPCQVFEVTEDRKILFTNMKTKEEGNISLDSVKVDLTPMKLGYMNFERGASYVSRIAKRRWKQGLDKAGVRFSGLPPRDGGWINSEAFLACYYNDYPTFEEAYLKAKAYRSMVAFHKKWAIYYTGDMYYRGKKVGTALKLDQAYAYLKQMMEAAT